MKNEDKCAAVTIILAGNKGAGKTTLLNDIGRLLKSKGYTVECLDEGIALDPKLQGSNNDNRLIRITVEGGI